MERRLEGDEAQRNRIQNKEKLLSGVLESELYPEGQGGFRVLNLCLMFKGRCSAHFTAPIVKGK